MQMSLDFLAFILKGNAQRFFATFGRRKRAEKKNDENKRLMKVFEKTSNETFLFLMTTKKQKRNKNLNKKQIKKWINKQTLQNKS